MTQTLEPTVTPSSSSGFELVLQSRFTHPENRRREAHKAAQARDLPALVELVEAYLRHKHGTFSRKTIIMYGVAVARWLEFTENPRVEIVKTTQDDLERFRDQLERVKKPKSEHPKPSRHTESTDEKPLKPRTRNLYLAGVSILFEALVWAKAMNHSPAQAVHRIRVQTPKGKQFKVLSDLETNALLTAPGEEYPNDPTRVARDQLLLGLGLLAGLRVSEITELNLNDISNTILYVHGKGSKDRQVPISKRLSKLIKNWLEHRPDQSSTKLILSLSDRNRGGQLSNSGAWRVVDRFFMAVKQADRLGGVHALRRAFGTRTYRATKDLHVVGGLLGHSSLDTTKIYATLDTDDLLAAVEAGDARLENGI